MIHVRSGGKLDWESGQDPSSCSGGLEVCRCGTLVLGITNARISQGCTRVGTKNNSHGEIAGTSHSKRRRVKVFTLLIHLRLLNHPSKGPLGLIVLTWLPSRIRAMSGNRLAVGMLGILTFPSMPGVVIAELSERVPELRSSDVNSTSMYIKHWIFARPLYENSISSLR